MSIGATARVVRGIKRTVRVLVPIVSRGPDGQVRYEGVAKAEFNIPVGDPVPVFNVDVRVVTEEIKPETTAIIPETTHGIAGRG